MTDKIKIFSILIILALSLFSAPCFVSADTLLSSPSYEGEKDAIPESLDLVSGDNIPANPNYASPVPCGEKIWGPQGKPCDNETVAKNNAAPRKCSLPPIKIRYKTYVGNGNYKYGKHMTSRGVRQVVWVDVAPIIEEEARKNGISPRLLKAIIMVESGFNTYAVGGGGAAGLCQLMPHTARTLGVKDPFNPYQNIAGGARYLGMLNRMFKGDLNRVIAGYNLGPGGVQYGIPSYAWGFINKVKKNM